LSSDKVCGTYIRKQRFVQRMRDAKIRKRIALRDPVEILGPLRLSGL
jgi:hypothetical protein